MLMSAYLPVPLGVLVIRAVLFSDLHEASYVWKLPHLRERTGKVGEGEMPPALRAACKALTYQRHGHI